MGGAGPVGKTIRGADDELITADGEVEGTVNSAASSRGGHQIKLLEKKLKLLSVPCDLGVWLFVSRDGFQGPPNLLLLLFIVFAAVPQFSSFICSSPLGCFLSVPSKQPSVHICFLI